MKIITTVVSLLLGCLQASAQDYSVGWFKVAGGGGRSSGVSHSVNGTVGQPDAGETLAAGNFSVTGGYWSQGLPPLPASESVFSITALDADRAESDDPQTQTNLLIFKITRGGNLNAAMAAVGWTVTGSGTNPADGQDFDFGGVFPGGTVNLAPGQTETNITIRVRGDVSVEADEEFTVTLNMPAFDSVIGSPATATGLIRNDDNAGTLPQMVAREGTRSWRGVASSEDGVNLAAVASNGYIYTSGDAGVNWTEQTSVGQKSWYAVAGSSDGTKLVAVADGARIFTSSDSGTSWTQQNGTSQRKWRSVASSADGSRLIAGVYSERLWTSTDSGVTWTGRENNRNWNALASSADGTKLVAVVQPGNIHTSTDGGTNWTARMTDQTRQWYGVASSADGTKLVACELGGQIHTSTDSGVSWTARESSRDWRSVTSSADGSRLVAAERDGQLYVSTDSGVNWTPIDVARNWYGLASSGNGAKVVASVFGGQLYTSDTTPPPPADSIFTITAVDTDRPETDDPQTQTNLHVFKITRGGNLNAAMAAVGWTVTGSGTNPADGQDFDFGGVFPGGTVNLAPGQTETNITIRVRGDVSVEADEEFTVTLNMPAFDSVIGSPATATGFIRNDDVAPSVFSITALDADRAESDDPQTQTNLHVFKITRGGNLNATMAAVGWTVTGSGTNPADGQDFDFGGVFPGGTVNLAPGQTETNITIRVRGDVVPEQDEAFTVTLSMPAFNSVLGTPSTANGLIRNDDGPIGATEIFITGIAGGNVSIRVVGSPNTAVRIEQRTVLGAGIWQVLQNGTTDGNGMLLHTDAGAGNAPQKYYRAGVD